MTIIAELIGDILDRFPFDWKTPFGYVIASAVQNIIMTYALSIGGCIVVFGIMCYLFLMGAIKSMTVGLLKISKKTRKRRHQKLTMQQLIEFFQFHSHMQQLSEKGLFMQFVAG